MIAKAAQKFLCVQREDENQKGVPNVLSEYTENSTIHGMRYASDRRRHWCERFFWLLSIFLSASFCCYSIYNVYQKWQESPIIVSFDKQLSHVSDIPFPAVTICPETKTTIQSFNFTKVFDALVRKISVEDITEDELLKIDAISQLCLPSVAKLFQSTNKFSNSSITDIIEQSALKLRDTVPSLLKWKNEDEVPGIYFREFITDEGLCFTFNSLYSTEIYTNEVAKDLNRHPHYLVQRSWSLDTGYGEKAGLRVYPLRTFDSGVLNGLGVLLKLNMSDVEYMCRGPYTGFKISLHLPVEIPRLSRRSIKLPLLKLLEISVKPNVMRTSPKLRSINPSIRKCYFESERQLRFFKVYTKQNCELECLSNFTKAYCGCVKFSMPRDNETKICGNGNMKCYTDAYAQLIKRDLQNTSSDGTNGILISRKGCNCLPACTTISYDMEISMGDYKTIESAESFARDLDNITKHQILSSGTQSTELSVFFNEEQFITLIRSELYGLTDFIAYCGGVLGLCLGFSLLSIVEIGYYLTLRVCFVTRQKGTIGNMPQNTSAEISNAPIAVIETPDKHPEKTA